METPFDQHANVRARIAFLLLFVFVALLSAGAYFIGGLSRLQEHIAPRESQAPSQGISGPTQMDEALRRNPRDKMLQMMAMATRAAIETAAAAEKLSNEVEPPALSRPIDLGKASRDDLEALRRDLKAAEANATALLPRYAALIKAERDKVATYALSLHAEKDVTGRFLDSLDRRHAQATAVTSGTLTARADYYRAYESYVAVLAGELGAYKVVDGQFIFPLQRTVDRYNVAAHAMRAAARRVASLEEERKKLMQSQQEGWTPIVESK